MRAPEAGFSLLEVLIASALFAVVALAAFELLRNLAADAGPLRARQAGYAALETLGERLRSEARSATAIWPSAPAAGAGHDDCVQLDFFAADAGGPKFWSYRNFPHHGSADAVGPDVLQRVAGSGPIVPCDPALPGETVLGGMTASPQFTLLPPVQLSAHQDPYLGVNDTPFVAASVPPTAPIPVGVLDALSQPVLGGNTVVETQLENAAGARVFDLLPGVFPNGFTEVLRYTCSERCDVGHDGPSAKTLTACAMTWQTQWSRYVPAGTAGPGGWFLAGTFNFGYAGNRADGGSDSMAQVDAASNWDPARNYAAFPPGGPAPDGSEAGSLTPWDVRAEAPAAWLADVGPYLAPGQQTALAVDKQRCDAVQQAGASGSFYANG